MSSGLAFHSRLRPPVFVAEIFTEPVWQALHGSKMATGGLTSIFFQVHIQWKASGKLLLVYHWHRGIVCSALELFSLVCSFLNVFAVVLIWLFLLGDEHCDLLASLVLLMS